MGLRGDAIAQLDWTVGRYSSTRQPRAHPEHTLVLFSSDNGGVIDDGYQDQAEELLRGAGPSGIYRGYKYSAFEGGTRILRSSAGKGMCTRGTALVSTGDPSGLDRLLRRAPGS